MPRYVQLVLVAALLAGCGSSAAKVSSPPVPKRTFAGGALTPAPSGTADPAARRVRAGGDARRAARPLRARDVPLHALPRRLPPDRPEPERGAPGPRPRREADDACSPSASTRRATPRRRCAAYAKRLHLVPQFRYLIGTPRRTAAHLGGLARPQRPPVAGARRPRRVHGARRSQGQGTHPLRRHRFTRKMSCTTYAFSGAGLRRPDLFS